VKEIAVAVAVAVAAVRYSNQRVPPAASLIASEFSFLCIFIAM
jgi:hypothetical protein